MYTSLDCLSRLLQIDQHIPILNLDRIHLDLGSGIVRGFSGLSVKRPTMPGTNNLAAFDHSLAERAAAVEANVTHGSNSAVHVGDADCFFTAREFFGFVVTGKVGLCG